MLWYHTLAYLVFFTIRPTSNFIYCLMVLLIKACDTGILLEWVDTCNRSDWLFNSLSFSIELYELALGRG